MHKSGFYLANTIGGLAILLVFLIFLFVAVVLIGGVASAM